jgi:hypothetical protein
VQILSALVEAGVYRPTAQFRDFLISRFPDFQKQTIGVRPSALQSASNWRAA